jgi:hypothetical protein
MNAVAIGAFFGTLLMQLLAQYIVAISCRSADLKKHGNTCFYSGAALGLCVAYLGFSVSDGAAWGDWIAWLAVTVFMRHRYSRVISRSTAGSSTQVLSVSGSAPRASEMIPAKEAAAEREYELTPQASERVERDDQSIQRTFPTAAARGVTRNYLARHWRGELPLGISYWVNGLLVNIIAVSGAFALGLAIGVRPGNYGPLVYWVVVWIFILVLSIWQAGGIWRSADNHITRKGSSTWGNLAKFAVVLGLLGSAGRFSNEGIPAIQEALRHADWLETHAKWNFQVLSGGREMEVSGGIGYGFSDDLEKMLDRSPTVSVLHVNLQVGGLIDEAYRARALIHNRGLATYTSGTCVSACTIVYLGGRQRFLKSGAKLGFHQPSFPGVKGADLASLVEKERDKLISLGIARDFANRALRTPATEMWFPEMDELVRSNVVTELTRGEQFGISGIKRSLSTGELQAELDKNPLFRAIREKEPKVYEGMLQRFQSGLRDGASIDRLRSENVPELQGLVQKHLPFASDDALRRFIRVLLAELRELQLASGRICIDYASGGNPDAVNAATKLFSDRVRAEEQGAIADVIQSSNPLRPRPSSAQFSHLMSQGIASIPNGELVVRSLNDPQTPPDQACANTIAFFEAIARLPAPSDALALRGLFAQQQLSPN